MFIESKLRTRIVSSMSWMVKTLKYKEDDMTGNLELGIEGGYSPELRQAIELLALLEATAPAPTEQQCRDMAAMMGLPESWGAAYFKQYASQGWMKGNGVPITDVALHMARLKAEGVEYSDAPAPAVQTDVQGLTPRQRNIMETGR